MEGESFHRLEETAAQARASAADEVELWCEHAALLQAALEDARKQTRAGAAAESAVHGRARAAAALHAEQLRTLGEQLRAEREVSEAREVLVASGRRALEQEAERTAGAELSAERLHLEVGSLRRQLRQCEEEMERQEDRHAQLLGLLDKHEELGSRIRAETTAINSGDAGLRVALQQALAEIDQLKRDSVSDIRLIDAHAVRCLGGRRL